MDLSNFILNGHFQGLKIATTLQNLKMPFHNMTDEDGDIPSLHNLGENEAFQFTALKNTVVGISFDFQYEPGKIYTISVEEQKFELGYSTSFDELAASLKLMDLDYEVQAYGEEESFEVLFKTSGVLLSFSKNNLLKASLFDLDLYEKISDPEYGK